jgi:hypothetical protein
MASALGREVLNLTHLATKVALPRPPSSKYRSVDRDLRSVVKLREDEDHRTSTPPTARLHRRCLSGLMFHDQSKG